MLCIECSTPLTKKQIAQRDLRAADGRNNKLGPFCSRKCFSGWKMTHSRKGHDGKKRSHMTCLRIILDIDLNGNGEVVDQNTEVASRARTLEQDRVFKKSLGKGRYRPQVYLP